MTDKGFVVHRDAEQTDRDILDNEVDMDLHDLSGEAMEACRLTVMLDESSDEEEDGE